MTVPDPVHVMSKVLLGESTITGLLLPQAALTGLATPPIFGYEYPRKETGKPASSVLGHDWAGLLKARSIELVLVAPSGRVPSGGDTSRAPWGRPRMDVQVYGRTYAAAATVLLAIHEYLKALSRVRAVLSGGTALLHDVTVEGGPISFPDPDTDSPVVVGIYAASVAEEFVVSAEAS